MKWLFVFKNLVVKLSAQGEKRVFPFLRRLFVNQKWRTLIFSWMIAAPFLGTAGFVFHQHRKLNALELSLNRLSKQLKNVRTKQAEKRAFAKKYQKACPDYVESELGKTPFLSRQIATLTAIKRLPLFSSCLPLKNRLEWLTKAENTLSFHKEKETTAGSIKEKIWSQAVPIQLDDRDLEELLEKIELTSDPKRPQIIIRSFQLERKGEQECPFYELKLELIERLLEKR